MLLFLRKSAWTVRRWWVWSGVNMKIIEQNLRFSWLIEQNLTKFVVNRKTHAGGGREKNNNPSNNPSKLIYLLKYIKYDPEITHAPFSTYFWASVRIWNNLDEKWQFTSNLKNCGIKNWCWEVITPVFDTAIFEIARKSSFFIQIFSYSHRCSEIGRKWRLRDFRVVFYIFQKIY